MFSRGMGAAGMLGMLVSAWAAALTGGGDSDPGALETVPPAVTGVVAADERALSVSFSEPLLAPDALVPGLYAVSGPGKGTLPSAPDAVSGGGPLTLQWNAGEMRGGEPVTVAVTGVRDALGNPLDPAQASASCPGVGGTPVFSGLAVSPARASAGQTVSITFAASETLAEDPRVEVNGRAAVRLPSVTSALYVYAYIVDPADPVGPARITMSGKDPAGNAGMLEDGAALEITAATPTMPLRAWPLAVCLAGAAWVVLARRRRHAALLALCAAALLSAPAARAADPAVTHVSFTQRPGAAGGTEVEILYDLDAPNGPCAVTVWLSKDGGADGFAHPVTAVTGDVAGVDGGAARRILWDIAADYPNEALPQARLRVVADDGVVQHTLAYLAGAGGTLAGEAVQTVNHGADGAPVTAVPDAGHHFTQWSDNVPQNPRTDTAVTADLTVTAQFAPDPPVVTSFALNAGSDFTLLAQAALDNTASNGPTEYQASASADFAGATWLPYAAAPVFALAPGSGARTVHFKVRGPGGESAPVSDTLFLGLQTVAVAAGGFPMGRTSAGDDAAYGTSEELPVHTATLAAYEIGKYEVTNRQFCEVLNWALARGLLSDSTGAPWSGTGGVFKYPGAPCIPVPLFSPGAGIVFTGGAFTPDTRTGLPAGTVYRLDDHPAVNVTWYGAVAFCNWLSEMSGLAPCYDISLPNAWPLTAAPPVAAGYRLPTEAEWERAAAWDGATHWIYPNTSDTAAAGVHLNGRTSPSAYLNPLGLDAMPYTSPVGWFDGVHVNPNGGAATVNACSPAGCRDMGGNAAEWCHDCWNYYAADTLNPVGGSCVPGYYPGQEPCQVEPFGLERATRGGGWTSIAPAARTARRADDRAPTALYSFLGFRVARGVITPAPAPVSFAINGGADTAESPAVTLDNAWTGLPVAFMASEAWDFAGASWQAWSAAPAFTLSAGVGTRTVYLKTYGPGGESPVMSDTIFLAPAMQSVPAGTFSMGRTFAGDDNTYGNADERPVHPVALAAYRIGTFEVTNKQFADVINWAWGRGYLKESTGGPYTGQALVYAGGTAARYLILTRTTTTDITLTGGAFVPVTRSGLPLGTNWPMDNAPMVMVSWYGAAAFCNWLGEMRGLPPCYNMEASFWPLLTPPPAPGGYRLPTEAEWERAAAWDGAKHWIYGFTFDHLSGGDRANYFCTPTYVNPLGIDGTSALVSYVGWFDGHHYSQNGGLWTVDSPSPAGCYDMTGNAAEWVGDWYLATWYNLGAMTNPTGPATGSTRVLRGGSWSDIYQNTRTALRGYYAPDNMSIRTGFRIAQSP